MATNPQTQEQKQLVLTPQVVKLGLGEDTAVSSLPVTRLKELRGNAQVWTVVVRAEDSATQSDLDIAAHEFNRLMARYGRYKTSASFLARLASLARVLGDIPSARRFALEAEEISASPELPFQRADFELTRGTNVEQSCETLLALAADGYRSAGLRLAEFYVAQSNYGRARELADAILEQDPLDWRTNLLAGTLALMEGRPLSAIRLFRVAATDRPRSTVLFTNLAIAHYVVGNVRQALKAIRVSLGLNPLDSKAVLFLLDVASTEKRLTPFIAHVIEQFLHFVPTVAHVIGRAATYFIDVKEYQQGIALLQQTGSGTNDPGVANNYGALLWAGGKHDHALVSFRRAIQLAVRDNGRQVSDDELRLILSNLAHALIEEGDIDAAQKLVRTALEGHTEREIITNEQLSNLRSADLTATLSRGDYEAVVEYAERTLLDEELHPKFRINLLMQVVCYYTITLERIERATQCALVARKTLAEIADPDESLVKTVLNNLAYCLLESNRYVEAETVLRELPLDDHETSTFGFATRGLYRIRRGNTDAGINDYRTAIQLTKKHERKALLKKKLEYELARSKESSDPRGALVHAKRARKLGEIEGPWPARVLESQIESLLRRLEQPPPH